MPILNSLQNSLVIRLWSNLWSRSWRLLSVLYPTPCVIKGIEGISLDLAFHEKLTQFDSRFDPKRTTDNGEFHKVGSMLETIRSIVPGCLRVPAFKVFARIEQDIELAAWRDLSMTEKHTTGGRSNNRAEKSHLPVRQGERRMQGLKSPDRRKGFSPPMPPSTIPSLSNVI